MGVRERLGVVVVALAASAAGLLGLAWWHATRSLGDIDGAAWVELPGGPALLVVGARYTSPDSGPSTYAYAWRTVDVRTGHVTRAHALFEAPEHPLATDGPGLWAAGGGSVLYADRDGPKLLVLATHEHLDRDELAAAWPAIAAPWFAVRGLGGARFQVEGDDRAVWTVDLATGAAEPAAGPLPLHHVDRCEVDRWAQPDGSAWRFARADARHSEGETELVRTGADGVVVERSGLLLPAARFLCDERTGGLAAFPNGDVLVGLPDHGDPPLFAVARLRADRTFAWEVPIAEPGTGGARAVQAFVDGEHAVVRVGTTVVGLGHGGGPGWTAEL